MRTAILILSLIIFVAACTALPPECKGIESENGRQVCMVDSAVAAKDATLCGKITATALQTDCYSRIAAVTNDPALCVKVAEQSRAFCERDVVIANGDAAGCAALSETPKDDCYSHFAQNETEWRHCLNIANRAQRDLCLEEISRKANDPWGCVKLTDIYPNRESCIFALSIATNTTETCHELLEREDFNFCIINIAAKTQQPELCEEAASDYRSICRGIVAKHNETKAENQEAATIQ